MKLDNHKDNNYYTNIDRTSVYVDLSSKRIKIVDISNITIQNLKRIIHYASRQYLGKVICNCDIEASKIFSDAGFKLEGKIDGFFKGKDAFCMSYFINSNREVCSNFIEKNSLVKKCLNVKNTFTTGHSNLNYKIRTANKNDIKEMIKLFSTVFSTYPSPIYDVEFLKETMDKKVLYKVAVYDGKIISIASADMDKENLNAEITDCATYPAYGGNGVLSNIIHSLECDLKSKGFMTLYSLSRAINPSINYVLSKHNYTFTGRMINNCTICGTFEDMNIWVKDIRNK
jgi:putative beta-lysine N-acetyltransferase